MATVVEITVVWPKLSSNGFVGDNGEFTGLIWSCGGGAIIWVSNSFYSRSWDAKDMELSSKKIDCIWNGFTINGREDAYTWTEPYMSNNQVFVVKTDSDINSLADLAGKTVAVQADSSAEAALADRQDLVDTFGEYIKAAD